MKILSLLFLPFFLFANQLSYYIDDSNLSIEEISKHKFTKIQNNQVNFGFDQRDIYIKVLSDDKPYFLIDNTLIDNINIYDENHKLIDKSGTKHINNSKSEDKLFYSYHLNKKETYILKINSIHAHTYRFYFFNFEEFQNYTDYSKLFLFFFFGFICSILIYAIIIYLVLKDTTYILYASFLASVFIFMLAYSGLVPHYFFKDNLTLVNIFVYKFDKLSILFAMLFTYKFLHLKSYDKWIKKGFIVASIPLFISLLYPNNYFGFFSLAGMIISILYTLVVVIYSIYIKNYGAKIFLFGWVLVLLGGLDTLVKLGSHTQINSFNSFGLYYGIIGVGVFFTLALSLKVKKVYDQRDNMRLEYQKKLQEDVDKKTAQLQEALSDKELYFNELQHRVKNNLQLLNSFISLSKKDDKDAIDKIKNKIESLSLLHEVFYTNKKELDINKLFKNLSSSIINTKKINFNSKSDVKTIDIDKLTTLTFITNELITNSVKHAFHNAEYPQIDINFTQNKDSFNFLYKDNGCGLKDKYLESKSMGFKILLRLSKKQLNADVDHGNDNGFYYKMEFKNV